MTRLLIGVGNPWRGDDGAGLEVARRVAAGATGGLRVVTREGDQTGLLDLWAGAEEAVVVDAAGSGAAPGTVHRLDAAAAPLPARLTRSSTHAFGVAEAVELARALGCLPPVLRVYAIEGSSFAAGHGLTPPVARAAELVAGELLALSAPADGPAPAS